MSRTRKLVLLLGVIVLGGGAVGFLAFQFKDKVPDVAFAVGLCVLVSMLLSSLPLLISYVQTTAKERQLAKLQDIKEFEVANTEYYKLAVGAVRSIKPARVLDPDYTVPILSFAFVVMFGCLMVFLGGFPEVDRLFTRNTFILGGMYTLDPANKVGVAAYQKGTLLVGGFAFVGSYVYMLGRLLDRINNNDIYPISYYYYVARFAIATLVAMTLRHVFTLFSTENAAILLVAFAIGFAPDLFVGAMLRRAYQFFKFLGNQNDPQQEQLPTNMSLLMIEGMTRDKIDRMTELGIDNAQILADQNPFMVWPRLPYSLSLIVDWIAQAQLYVFLKETGTKAVRQKGITNICDLYAAFKDQQENAATDVASTAGLFPSAIATYIAALDANPSFRDLKEVRDKL